MAKHSNTSAVVYDAVEPPYTYGKFEFSSNGLRVLGVPTYEEWVQVGHKLSVDIKGIQLQVGDWLRIGEQHFGELAAQVIDARHWKESTVRVYRYVAERVPIENRMLDRGLDYSHLQAVAKLPPQVQKQMLDKAVEGDGTEPWSVNRLKQEIAVTTKGGVVTYGVTVMCQDEADQLALIRQLENLGRITYKAFCGHEKAPA